MRIFWDIDENLIGWFMSRGMNTVFWLAEIWVDCILPPLNVDMPPVHYKLYHCTIPILILLLDTVLYS